MTRNAPHLVQRDAAAGAVAAVDESRQARAGAGGISGRRLPAGAGGTPSSTLPRSRRISAQRVVEMAPTVARDGLAGGLLAYDGQLIDDARLVTAVARTAAQHGATDPHLRGSIRGHGHLGAVDRPAHGTVVRRVGRAQSSMRPACGRGEIDASLKLRPSRGTHLVFDASAFANPTAALTVPIPGELNRFVFAMPEQLGRVYLGLTDEDAPGPIPDVPEPSSEEIKFLLDTVNTALGTALATDVIGAYAGLRPLIDTGGGPHRRCFARPRRIRVAVRRDQRGRRQADRIPLHGAGRAGSRDRPAAAACRGAAALAICR